MNNAQLINQDSGKVEYYTPGFIIEAVRKTMGSIDFDPASSHEANKRVKACMYICPPADGLAVEWSGNVWMNHPFSREGNPKWVNKIVSEYLKCRVKQACCITYASTGERWFRRLAEWPQAFLCPRTNFILPNGKVKRGCPKGSVVTYFGPRVGAFAAAFRELGAIKIAI